MYFDAHRFRFSGITPSSLLPRYYHLTRPVTLLAHFEDDMVRAAVQYVKAYEHSPKHKNHEIFNNGKDEGLSAARVCQILNHAWISGDVCTFLSCLFHVLSILHPC